VFYLPHPPQLASGGREKMKRCQKASRTLPSHLRMITPSLCTLLELPLVAQVQLQDAGVSWTRPASTNAMETLHSERSRVWKSCVKEDRSVLSSFSFLSFFLYTLKIERIRVLYISYRSIYTTPPPSLPIFSLLPPSPAHPSELSVPIVLGIS